MKIADLHIHSDYSDGSDTIDALMKNVINAGIETFALTDHDIIEGCVEMEKLVPSGINFIKGIELTCTADYIKCHILGYNCDTNNVDLNKLIQEGKLLRKRKLEKRIQYLQDVWNIELSDEENLWVHSRKSVVKTHLANILVKRKLAADNVSAMKKYLDDCITENSRFDAKQAIQAIISSGGMPIWAHPLGGEGEKHISQNEFITQLETMKKFGIQGLECYYSRYNFDEIAFLVKCAELNNIFISGGSDYHGYNKDIPLAKMNTNNEPINSDKLNILKNLKF